MNQKNFIPYGKQSLDEADIQSVIDALKHDFITQGPRVKEFEQRICEYTGAPFCVAVSNCTAGLHLATLASGLNSQSTLVTSPISFLASANCGEYVGATVDFVDINPSTFNLDHALLEKRLKKGKVDCVVAVDFAGRPCNLKEIHELKKQYGFTLIEDAAHAFGSEYRNGKVGSGIYSDFTVFSFHPVKTLTTAEGGAITTHSKELYEKLFHLRSHGMHKNLEDFQNKELGIDSNGNPNLWYYEMSEIGFNYRITDLQCALGISQLKRVDEFIDKRNEIIQKYNNAFKDLQHIKPPLEAKERTAFHLYVALIDFKKIKKTRNQIMHELREYNVGSQVHYIPIHLQPYYRNKYGFKYGDFKNAETYYESTLSLPLFPKMRNSEIEHVIETVKNVIG